MGKSRIPLRRALSYRAASKFSLAAMRCYCLSAVAKRYQRETGQERYWGFIAEAYYRIGRVFSAGYGFAIWLGYSRNDRQEIAAWRAQKKAANHGQK